MSSKPGSRWLRTLLGVSIGAVVGLQAAEGPFVGALIGGLIGFLSVGAGGTAPRREADIARFLREAYLAGDVDDAAYARLRDRLLASAVGGESRSSVSAPPAPVRRPQAPQSAPEPGAEPAPPGPEPRSVAVSSTPRAARGTSRARRARLDVAVHLRPLREAWDSLRADFAVQGLGSLGVLLVFTATLGFVVFAFTEVGVAFRPVAELIVPVVLFVMSGLLRRRSAPFMATALEGLGGAVTPIMVFAAFSDGSPLPPDVDGAGRLAVLAGASVVLAAAYARVARTRRSTPLRFLVAPLVWVGLGVLGTAIDRSVSAASVAVALAGIGATPWLLRRRSGHLAAAARSAVLPGLGIGYALLALFAFAEGWPAGPVLLGGGAAVAATEGVADRVRRVWLAEAMVIAVTGLAVVPDLGAGWSGFGTTVAALLLMERWRRSDEATIVVRVAGSIAAIGVLAAITDEAATLAGGLAVATWGHARRAVPVPAFWFAPQIAGAIAPAIAAYGLAGVTAPTAALVTMGAGLLILAGALRMRSVADPYLASGTLVYAAGVGLLGVLPDLVDPNAAVAGALGAAAIAVAIVPHRPPARVWLATTVGLEAWFVVTGAAGFSTAAFASGAAVGGLLLVAAGVLVSGAVGGHLAAVGHLIGTMALPLVVHDPMRITVLAAWIAAWLLELASEPAASPLQRLAGARLNFELRSLMPLPVLAAAPVLAMAVVDEVRPTAGLAGVALVLGGTAVVYGVVAGGPVWRPALSAQAGPAAVVVSVLSLGPAGAFDPLLVADRALQAVVLGCGIVGVAAIGRRAAPWMQWYAWALASPLAAVAGLSAGLSSHDVHWAVFGWGATTAVAALTIDGAWTKPREPLSVTRGWLRPPVVVGSITASIAAAAGLFDSLDALWPLALTAALWTGAMAYLLRAEPLLFAPLSLATLGYASALASAGFDVLAEPVLLTWPALVLLGLAAFAPRIGRLGRPDVPALAVGLVVAGLAVTAGFVADATDGTWAPIGAALVLLGAVKREWLALTVAGSALMIAAAAFAGPWWLASVLALHSVALTGVARVVAPPSAPPLQWAAAGFGGAAWAAGLWAGEATAGESLALTSAAAGAVAVLGGVGVWRRPDPGHHAVWTGPWAVVTLAALAVAATIGIDAGVQSGSRWALAVAVAIWSAAAVYAGTVLDRDELRFLATASVVVVVAATGWAADLATNGWAILVLGAAVTVTSVGAVASQAVARAGWTAWLLADAALLHVAGVGLAALLLPERTMLVVALLAAAGASIAIDLLVEVHGARYLAPGLVFGAWLSFITEAAATANAQWYVPPFALAVLVDLEMVRRRRRAVGRTPTSTDDMAVVELVAIALLVAPSFVQIVLESIGYGLAAIGWGTVVAAWGTATQVRRRLVAGGLAAAVGAVLMVAVPVARLLPEFRGPALWGAVFALGALLITVAATLEHTKRRLGEVKSTFGRMTVGWE